LNASSPRDIFLKSDLSAQTKVIFVPPLKVFVYWDAVGIRYETPINSYILPENVEFVPVDRCRPYRNADTLPKPQLRILRVVRLATALALPE
jgi:hypothetical protein